MGVHYGTVVNFDNERGFGFCACDAPSLAGGRDLFLAAAALRRCGIATLAKGDRISFDIRESQRHPGKFEAKNVAVVERAEAA